MRKDGEKPESLGGGEFFFEDEKNKDLGFEGFLDKYKVRIAFILLGLTLIGFGVFIYRQGYFVSDDKVEIISDIEVSKAPIINLVAEISGAVQNPGVYKLSEGARIDDLLIAAGGLSAEADREWIEKFINRAAKISDGQKVYILRVGEQSNASSAKDNGGIKPDQGVNSASVEYLVNINTASLSELDSLPGIGQVYGQSIIEHRPYSNVEELLSKGVLKQTVFDKVKDKVAVY